MDIPERLIELIASGNCTLFLGSGASREASAPIGTELIELLMAKFQKHDITSSQLRQFVDVLETTSGVDREDIDKTIVQALQVCSPSEAHLVLPYFVWQGIFTTNYDRLVEVAYDMYRSKRNEPPLQECNIVLKAKDQMHMGVRSHVNLYKLHGCIGSIGPGTPLVLASRDYKVTAKKRRNMLRILKSLATEHSFLFIGFSFADEYMLDLLDEIQEQSPYHQRRSMFLVLPELSRSDSEFFRSRNFEHIPGTFAEFFNGLLTFINKEARKKALTSRIRPVYEVAGRMVSIPTSLRVSLDSQMEIFVPEGIFSKDPKKFLSGFPPSVADLKSRNDIIRDQQGELSDRVSQALSRDTYVRPIIVVLGPGGTGKSTLAARVAYDIAEQGVAISCRLKNPDQWNIDDIVNFCERLECPMLFVIDGIEIRSWLRATRDLRYALSVSRVNATLLVSCQKTVWNEYKNKNRMDDREIEVFDLEDRLSFDEAASLVDKLIEARLLTADSAKKRELEISQIINECEGHLVVALLEIVRGGNFKEIVLNEYENLSERAQSAYRFVALLHQHRISTPGYLLNALSTDDWGVFLDQVIRQESELVIIHDLDAITGRLMFRSRHPVIAKTIIDAVVPEFDDKIRMFRKIFYELGTSAEDRSLALTLLTTESVRREIREEQYLSKFFDCALDLFPEDRDLILQFGRHENKARNYDRAREILGWGRELNPRDSHILHQLGVCAQRRASSESSPLMHHALIQEARAYFREVQEIDPLSRYGYVSEAHLAINLAKKERDPTRKLTLLSEAESIVAQGLHLVREDDHGFLQGCKAEIAGLTGNVDRIIEQLAGLEARNAMAYGSLYHMWASCLVEKKEVDQAIEIIKRGVTVFPGDQMLIHLMLQLLERMLYRTDSRDLVSEFIGVLQKQKNELNVWILFIRGVVEIYDTQYTLAKQTFREVRNRLRSRGSTRIRVFHCDESGSKIQRRGIIQRRNYGRPWIRDLDTGMEIPMDNHQRWESAGKPHDCMFEMGFSLIGPRAFILGKYANCGDVEPPK